MNHDSETRKNSLIYLDFDGVIADTTSMKHAAFLEVAHDMGVDSNDLHRALISHLSGSERRLVADWIKARYPHVEKELFLSRFASAVAERIQSIKLRDGFEIFLRAAFENRWLLAIVSNAPKSDNIFILENCKVSRSCFVEVIDSSGYGKVQSICDFLERYHLEPKKSLFIGDMPSDLRVASDLKIPFIGFSSIVGEQAIWGEHKTGTFFESFSDQRLFEQLDFYLE